MSRSCPGAAISFSAHFAPSKTLSKNKKENTDGKDKNVKCQQTKCNSLGLGIEHRWITECIGSRSRGKYTTAIRICHSTKAELERVVGEVERNGGKKKIKADTVIRFALAKLKEQDFEELRARTISYSELFDREFLRYKSEESDVNRDEFLGLVLLGKVKVKGVSALTK